MYQADFADPYAQDANAEYKAAHEAGVCHECHMPDGLHDEGRCSQWRDGRDDDE